MSEKKKIFPDLETINVGEAELVCFKHGSNHMIITRNYYCREGIK